MSKLENNNLILNSIFDKMRKKYKETEKRRPLSQDIIIDNKEEVIVKSVYTKRKIRLKKPNKNLNIEEAKKARSVSKIKEKRNISLTFKKKLKKADNSNYKYIPTTLNKKLKYENNIIIAYHDINTFRNNNIKILIKIINKIYFNKIKLPLENYLKSKNYNNKGFTIKQKNKLSDNYQVINGNRIHNIKVKDKNILDILKEIKRNKITNKLKENKSFNDNFESNNKNNKTNYPNNNNYILNNLNNIKKNQSMPLIYNKKNFQDNKIKNNLINTKNKTYRKILGTNNNSKGIINFNNSNNYIDNNKKYTKQDKTIEEKIKTFQLENGNLQIDKYFQRDKLPQKELFKSNKKIYSNENIIDCKNKNNYNINHYNSNEKLIFNSSIFNHNKDLLNDYNKGHTNDIFSEENKYKINKQYKSHNPSNIKPNSNIKIMNDNKKDIIFKKDNNSLKDKENDLTNNIINDEKMANNKINKNFIVKNGEIFYSTRNFLDEINSNSLNGCKNKSFSSSSSCSVKKERNKSNENDEINLQYRIVDEKNKIITLKKDKDKHLKKEITLNLNSSKKEFEKINEKNKEIKPISIRFYKIFIKELIDEINENNDINNIISDREKNMLNNNIQKFKRKLFLFKKYILHLIVKKHYLKSFSQKMELIKNKSIEIQKYRNFIYDLFKKIKNSIISIKDTNKRKEYNKKMLSILKKYEKINHQDIKNSKKHYINKRIPNKNNFSSLENNSQIIKNNAKTKLFLKLSLVILPLVYIINFFNVYQKDYSLIETI